MKKRETENLIGVENESKLNLSQEEMEFKKKRAKNIKTGILLMLMLPISVFILAMDLYPNETVYMISSLFCSLCTFVGFCKICFALTPQNENSVTAIAGHVIDNEDIKNIDKMTFSEKIKSFYVIEVILRILSIPATLGFVLLLFEDPMNLFTIFSNPAIAQIIVLIILVIILNGLFVFFPREKISKKTKIMTLIGQCIFICYFIYYIFNLA